MRGSVAQRLEVVGVGAAGLADVGGGLLDGQGQAAQLGGQVQGVLAGGQPGDAGQQAGRLIGGKGADRCAVVPGQSPAREVMMTCPVPSAGTMPSRVPGSALSNTTIHR